MKIPPVIVGWAEEAIVGIELDGSAEVNRSLLLFKHLNQKWILEGEFTVDDRMIETNIYPCQCWIYEMYNETK